MTITGHGHPNIARDLYRSAALQVIAVMRRDGAFVCIGNVLARMPEYNQEMLSNTLWSLAREGLLT